MPKATGHIRWTSGVATARIRITSDARESFALACRTEAEADERAKILADAAQQMRRAQIDLPRAREALKNLAGASSAKQLQFAKVVAEDLIGGRLEGVPSAPTFKELGEQWTKGELAKRYPDQVRVKRSVDDDKIRLAKYVYDVIGHLPIDHVTLDACEDVMRRLPEELAPATRRHVGLLISRILTMAVYPLRMIERSPIPKGFMPTTGKTKALAYLYPSEDRRLLACRAAPLEYRLLWGVLAREGMREGEALALTWADLDLERGAIRLDTNKTDDPRAWALDAGVHAALSAYREQRAFDAEPHELVFPGRNGETRKRGGIADLFRRHLQKAGIDKERPELFTTTAERQRIRVHDLRATFVTLGLANGRTEAWISDRTGHHSSAMINRYRRAARTVAELGLGELAPLIEAIPELSIGPRLGHSSEPIAKSKMIPASCDGVATGLQNRNPDPQAAEIADFPGKLEGAVPSRSVQIDAVAQPRPNGASPVESCGPMADPVEAALAEALTRAATAGQWDVVGTLSRELQARREARAGVVQLDSARRRKS